METNPNKRIVEDVYIEIYGEEMDDEEVKRYLEYLRNKHKQRSLESLVLTIDGEYVDMKYKFAPEPFERIRRITGWPNMDSLQTA